MELPKSVSVRFTYCRHRVHRRWIFALACSAVEKHNTLEKQVTSVAQTAASLMLDWTQHDPAWAYGADVSHACPVLAVVGLVAHAHATPARLVAARLAGRQREWRVEVEPCLAIVFVILQPLRLDRCVSDILRIDCAPMSEIVALVFRCVDTLGACNFMEWLVRGGARYRWSCPAG